ncbi:MAG: hypothetical protein IJ088_14000 [Clostridia bacterium]|nr:hypothetical protein [Clostridia bacterium]
MKILNPVMYSNFGPVTIEDDGKTYKCELVTIFGNDFGEIRGEKKYFCKIEFFNDHQVLHKMSKEEMEECRKNYREYMDVM